MLIGITIPAYAATGNIIILGLLAHGSSAIVFSHGILFDLQPDGSAGDTAFRGDVDIGLLNRDILCGIDCMVITSAASNLLNFRLQEICRPVFSASSTTWV